MNVTHEQVNHHQFGIGIITDQTMTTVTVEFCQQHGVKKFLYPSAFELFLELCNPVSQEKVNGELRQIREEIEAERRRCEEENKKIREEERLAILEQKRAAAKKRSPAKKRTAKPKKQPEDAKPNGEGIDV
jgi:hypothetical protein